MSSPDRAASFNFGENSVDQNLVDIAYVMAPALKHITFKSADHIVGMDLLPTGHLQCVPAAGNPLRCKVRRRSPGELAPFLYQAGVLALLELVAGFVAALV